MPYHRSEEHTSELQSHDNLVCRLLLEKKRSLSPSSPCSLRVRYTPTPTDVTARLAHRVDGRELGCRWSRGIDHAGIYIAFFFTYTAPPKIYLLPPRGAFPI